MTEQIRKQNAEYQKSLEERISVLVEEQKQLVKLNEQQAKELKSREDANVLKSTIHRLNQELSRYQIKFRKLDDTEVRIRCLDLPGIVLSL